MRTELLLYSVEIARSRSLNKAAQRLGVTQPALSAALNSLEDELGFKIFLRSHQGMELTPEGETFVRDAQTIHDIMEGWKRLAETAAEIPPAVLAVANPVAYNTLIVPAVRALHEVGARMDVYPYESKNRLIPSFLADGRARIGLMLVLPKDLPGLEEQAHIRQWTLEPLIEDRFQVFLSARARLARKKQLVLADLADMRLAVYPDDDPTTAMPLFARHFASGRLMRLSHFEHLLDAIAEDRAVGVFPARLMRNIPQVASGAVRSLPLADMDVPVRYYLLAPAPGSLSSAEKRFLRELKSHLPEE